MRKRYWEYLILAGIFAVYLGVTGYHLRLLPGEWYGDITIEHRQVLSILSGGWPWKFHLSAGPAYHYLVAALAYFLGTTYETYKLASLVTGLAVILLLYLLGKELAGVRVGLLTALVGALSFWLILFARLGSSPQILSPVLSAGTVYFLLRFQRARHWYDAAASMFFAGWGLFTYPATFVLPPLVLALIGWQLIFARQRMPWLKALAVALALMIPFVFWFVHVVKTSPDFSQSGYVGSKVEDQGASPTDLAVTFGRNMVVAMGMFQWTGDHAFRTNASGKPMLDPFSSALMAVGIAWLLLDRRLRPRFSFVFIPIVILLMPSAAPGIPAVEIPSASRALGAAPFAFLLVALGLEAAWLFTGWLFTSAADFLRRSAASGRRPASTGSPGSNELPTQPVSAGRLAKNSRRGRVMGGVLVSLAIIMIGYLNLTKYFDTYAWGLPEHNQPWGYQIAQYIDALPSGTPVQLAACCWGAWKQPEPEGIYYVLKHPQGRENILSGKYIHSCEERAPGETVAVIFPPDANSELVNTLRDCFPGAQGEMHFDRLDQPVFYSLLIR